MATVQELERALINADKAGDIDAARKLAAALVAARQTVETETEAPSFGQRLVRQLGLTAKAGIEGAASGAGAFVDPVIQAIGAGVRGVTGSQYQPDTLAGLGRKATQAIGLPEPMTTQERIAQAAAQGVAGAASGIGAAGTVARNTINAPQQIATELTKNAGTQLAAGGAAGFGGQAAEESGAGALGQLAASLAAGVGVGSVASKLQAAGMGARSAPSSIQEAESRGIRVTTSDVLPPTSAPGKIAQSLVSKIPLAGTGGIKAEQQTQRIQAVKELVQDFGADVPTRFDDVIYKSLTNKRSDELSKLTSIKNAIKDSAPSNMPVPVSNTAKAFDDEIAAISRIGAPGDAPAIQALQDWKAAFANNADFKTLDSLRARFGQTITQSEPGNIRTALEQVSSRIYSAVKEDMREFLKQAQGEPVANKWALVNGRLADGVNELKRTRLRTVLNKGEATPEVVNNLLLSQKPSEVRLLMRNLTDEGRAAAQSSVIQRVVERSGGIENISPDRFLNELNRLGPQVQNVFQGADKQSLEGLMKALQLTRSAGRLSAAPETGAQALPTLFGIGLTGLLGPGGAIATGGGVGLLGRAYESKAVRNALIKLNAANTAQAQANALTNLQNVTRVSLQEESARQEKQ